MYTVILTTGREFSFYCRFTAQAMCARNAGAVLVTV